jgi:polyketide synthase PksM
MEDVNKSSIKILSPLSILDIIEKVARIKVFDIYRNAGLFFDSGCVYQLDELYQKNIPLVEQSISSFISIGLIVKVGENNLIVQSEADTTLALLKNHFLDETISEIYAKYYEYSYLLTSLELFFERLQAAFGVKTLSEKVALKYPEYSRNYDDSFVSQCKDLIATLWKCSNANQTHNTLIFCDSKTGNAIEKSDFYSSQKIIQVHNENDFVNALNQELNQQLTYDLIVIQQPILSSNTGDIVLDTLKLLTHSGSVIVLRERMCRDNSLVSAIFGYIQSSDFRYSKFNEKQIKEKLLQHGYQKFHIHKVSFDFYTKNLITFMTIQSDQNYSEIDISKKESMESIHSNQHVSQGKVEHIIFEVVAHNTGIKPSELDVNIPFAEYGVNSIRAIQIIIAINKALSIKLSKTALYVFPTIKKLHLHICKTWPSIISILGRKNTIDTSLISKQKINLSTFQQDNKVVETDKIAIIGMAGYFPGAASIEEFWQQLLTEHDACQYFNSVETRWNVDEFCKCHAIDIEKFHDVKIGFINDAYRFDSDFFHISPTEAKYMDPMQRMLLEVHWLALDNAGYTLTSVEGSRCGVFVGMPASDYRRPYDTNVVAAYSLAGTNNAAAAARISYFLNLKGPNISIDTACSSSLVAVHMACQNILSNECDIALASGACIMHTPTTYLMMKNMGMISPKGRCAAFDNNADGVVISEAVAAVVLKRLSQAINDKDNIYAIIEGSAIGYDGKTNGLTAPSMIAQKELQRNVYHQFNINPHNIIYLESHGTGTKLGDPIEVQAASSTFAEFRCKKQFCAIGSVKTNIGHTLNASGIIGLIKAALCLNRGLIPPNLHYKSKNEEIDFLNSPFYVVQKLINLSDFHQKNKMVAINSFGFSGTNCHMVLSQYEPMNSLKIDNSTVFLIPFSSHTQSLLNKYLSSFVTWLEGNKTNVILNLHHLSYTLSCRKTHYAVRIAFIVKNVDDLLKQVTHYLKNNHAYNFSTSSEIKEYASKFVPNIPSDIEKAFKDYMLHKEVDLDNLFTNLSVHNYCIPSYKFGGKEFNLYSKPLVSNQDTSCATFQSDIYNFIQLYDEYNLNDMKCIKNHRVMNEPTFPGVLYLDFIARALQKRTLQNVFPFCATNITFCKPFTDSKIDLYCHFTMDNQKVEVRQETTGSAKRHCYMSCCITKDKEKRLYNVPIITDILNRCKKNISRDELYKKIRNTGIEHGDYYQTIKSIWTNKNEVLCLIELDQVHNCDSQQWIFYPPLLDAVFQPTILLGTPDGNMLPFHIEKFLVFSSLPDVCYTYVYNTGKYKYNVDILSLDGNIIGHIENITFRSYKQQKKDQLLFLPKFIKIDDTLLAEKVEFFTYEQIVIIYQSNGGKIQRSLCKNLSQNNPWLIELGYETKKISDRHYLVDVSSEIKWDNFLPHGIKSLKIFFLSDISDENISSNINIISFDQYFDMEEVRLYTLFSFAKALLLMYNNQISLQLILVTHNCSEIYNSSINPFASALHGFALVLPKEYQRLQVKIIDFDMKNVIAHGLDISKKILQIANSDKFHHGEIYYLHADTIYLRRMYAIESIPIGEESSFIKGGVYLIIGGAGGLGFELSKHLAKHYQAKIFWIGRRQINSTINGHISEIEILGGHVSYISGDIRDKSQYNIVSAQLRKKVTKFNGLIHSALYLCDKVFLNMTRKEFDECYHVKSIGSIFSAKLARDFHADFIMFFSSIQSLANNPGQINYSAASMFQDSFATYCNHIGIKTLLINWGYWGTVGAVASPDYQDRIIALGMRSISPNEGMAVVEYVLRVGINQVAVIKATNNTLTKLKCIVPHTQMIETLISNTSQSVSENLSIHNITFPEYHLLSRGFDEVKEYAQDLLLNLFFENNIFTNNITAYTKENILSSLGVIKSYHKLIIELLNLLVVAGYLICHSQNGYYVTEKVISDKQYWDSVKKDARQKVLKQKYPAYSPHIQLITHCLSHYLAVIRGEKTHMEILFPQGSKDMVSGVYQNNIFADKYNMILAKIIKDIVSSRNNHDTINILEIGAGTGATTKFVLEALSDVEQTIEYYFTDVSKSFLKSAEQRFSSHTDSINIQYKLLDIDLNPLEQTFSKHNIDIIIATNVLHATCNINTTFDNIITLANQHSHLLINEVVSNHIFPLLVFGLTPGWWCFNDAKMRIPGSPLLDISQWETVFKNHAMHLQSIYRHNEQGVIETAIMHCQIEHSQYINCQENICIINDKKQIKENDQPIICDDFDLKIYIRNILADVLEINPRKIDYDKSLDLYGIDSLIALEVINKLSIDFPDLPATLLFEYVTITELVQFLQKKHSQQIEKFIISNKTVSCANDEDTHLTSLATCNIPNYMNIRKQTITSFNPRDIAIIGMAFNYPDADNQQNFWLNLSQSKTSFYNIVNDRWCNNNKYRQQMHRLCYTPIASLLTGVDHFEPFFFNISPSEAEILDPQERIFLQVAWNTFEDAGYALNRLCKSKTGIFIGVMNSDYYCIEASEYLWKRKDLYCGHWSIANRISYFLNLTGPSLAVNTACSSSLVAIHLGCESLIMGNCEQALCGGVNLILHPQHHIGLSNKNVLSPTGKNRSFGMGADGFVPGEGVGGLLLKPLSRAVSDGDHIYGVIKGSAVNHGGKTHGYTVPNPTAQAEVITQALKQAGVDARSISYVEAHGTGTELGDPIEIRGLSKAFSTSGEEKQYCAIGSLKSNIGHLESAAGIAGITKVLLQFKHKQLAPSLHAEQLNPNIDFSNTPFYVQRELAEWKVSPEVGIRRAGVSSFGAGGTNAHVVLEEWQGDLRDKVVERSHYLLVLSGKTKEALSRRVTDLLAWLENVDNASISLADISYTLLVGREHFRYRYACVVKDKSDMLTKLSLGVNAENIAEIFVGDIESVSTDRGIYEQVFSELSSRLAQGLQSSRYSTDMMAAANLYVRGYQIDGKALYHDEMVRRIALPTYPFMGKSYWINDVEYTSTEKGRDDVVELPRESEHLYYYHRVWSEQALLEKRLPIDHVLFIGQHQGRSKQLRTCLSGRLQHIYIGPPNDMILGDGEYYIEPSKVLNYERILKKLFSKEPIHRVWIDASSLCDVWMNDQQFDVIFHIHQALLKCDWEGEVLLSYDDWLAEGRLLGGLLSGFARSFHQEQLRIRIQVLGLSKAEQAVEEALNELRNRDHAVEVCYRNGQRCVLNYERCIDNRSNRKGLRHGGVYLITGGMGGIGQVLAEYLLTTYDAHVVLMGRRVLSKVSYDWMEGPSSNKGSLNYYRGDVSDEADVNRVFSQIEQSYGVLHGIFHGAGLLRDALLSEKTEVQWREVLLPKVKGTLNLDKGWSNKPLDFFVMFSSIVSWLGNDGQTDYGAANGFLDGYVLYREEERQRGNRQGITLTVNWPLWQTAGMQMSTQQAQYLAEHLGLLSLPVTEGMKSVEDLLTFPSGDYGVLYGDEKKITQLFLNQSRDALKPTLSTNKLIDMPELKALLTKDLLLMMRNLLKAEEGEVTGEMSFGECGFDSLLLKEFSLLLNRRYQLVLTPAVFFSHDTVTRLIDYLLQDYGEPLMQYYDQTNTCSKIVHDGVSIDSLKKETITRSRSQVLVTSSNSEGIAIIGLSGYFPQSKDLEIFWRKVANNEDMVSDMPVDRLNLMGIDTNISNDQIAMRWGGFIPDVTGFDAEFFHISPREASLMDPQQRLFLQAAYHAIEDSGYSVADLANTPTGVFVGIQSNEYQELLALNDILHTYNSTGNVHSIVANRISYLFNLTGPSETVDTACSSSLVAINRAIHAINNGECTACIVGAVNLLLSSGAYQIANDMGILSQIGHCSTFSSAADGYVRGEGVGAVLLKPLSQAVSDGDHIYGVIKGSAVNHGGKANSLTAPNAKAQSDLLIKAYRQSGIDPHTVTYIEAHGTGTELGDPVEVDGLKQAFKVLLDGDYEGEPYCGLGSVKANIGHLEPAAGIAGVIKVLLSMQHGYLPGNPHLREANPYIDLEGSPFYLLREGRPWNRLRDKAGIELPRRAGVSSFGFGGTNAHVVLEEWQGDLRDKVVERSHYLLVLSGKTKEALSRRVMDLLAWLENVDNASISLADISYTLLVGREHFRYRYACVVDNIISMQLQLKLFSDGEKTAVAYSSIAAESEYESPLYREIIDKVLQELHEITDTAAYQHKLQVLAELYVKGYPLSTTDIFAQQYVRRTALPGYPFVNKRFWFADLLNEYSIACATKKKLSVYETEERFGHYNKSEQTYKAEISSNEPFVVQHVINENRILSGAYSLCVCMHILYQLGLQESHIITNITWLNFVSFNTNQSKSIVYTTRLLKQNYVIEGTVDDKLFFTADLKEKAFENPIGEKQLQSLSAIDRSNMIDHETLYKYLCDSGMNFGLLYRRIAWIKNSDQAIFAKLMLPKQKMNNFVSQMTLFDAGFQSITGYSLSENLRKESRYVPYYVESLSVYKSLQEAEYIYAKPHGNGQSNYYDIYFLDGWRHVIAKMIRYSVKEIMHFNTEASANPLYNHILKNDVFTQESSSSVVIQLLQSVIAKETGISASKIQPDTCFDTLDFDSVIMVALVRGLEEHFGLLPKTLFYEHKTVYELVNYLTQTYIESTQKLIQTKFDYKNFHKNDNRVSTNIPIKANKLDIQSDDIVIVGVAGYYPHAHNVYELWNILRNKQDCITNFDNTRKWLTQSISDELLRKSLYSSCGGFLQDIQSFDAKFFGITPKEAAVLDPQERLFLQVVYNVIEDAGYAPNIYSQSFSDTGVYVGVMYGDYQLHAASALQHQQIRMASSSYASIANRISYYFNLIGPCFALDTMCSSSLAALHLACHSIRNGEISSAIVGGVNITTHINKYLLLCANQFLSSDGKCKSFGAGGDGYVPGEGVGALLLKPLSRAVSDGDHIYGVIKGSAVNHGGKTHGYTVPNPTAQAEVITQALKQAGVDARSISYVEAHGTGTELGDPIEIRGLSKAFSTSGEEKQYCAIGSLKSNIGHLESAAGIAGITKVLLQFKHKQLAPSLHAEQLNPNIDFSNTPFYVQRELAEWKVSPEVGIRRAGVSSFGAGGTNAHVVLEEWQGDLRDKVVERSHYLLVLSGKTKEALSRRVTDLLAWLENVDNASISLADISYTLLVGREHFRYRYACVVKDKSDMLAKLSLGVNAENIAEIFVGDIESVLTDREVDKHVFENLSNIFLQGVETSSYYADMMSAANLYVRGYQIDGKILYCNESMHRVPLPIYSFDKNKHWIDYKNNNNLMVDRDDATMKRQRKIIFF